MNCYALSYTVLRAGFHSIRLRPTFILQPLTTRTYMLFDTFGRVHDYLRISLTDTCNYRCQYCLPSDADEEYTVDDTVHLSGTNTTGSTLNVIDNPAGVRMSADEIIELAQLFVLEGVRKIRLTGGEPLLRSDAKQIIERLSLLPVQLCLSTNGSKLDSYISTLLQCGVRNINVSLDSLNASTFHRLTGRNEFDKVKANIDRLVREDFVVKVNVVVMNGYNDNEIQDFIEWTRYENIHLRFIEFMPFPGNHWRPEKLMSFDDILAVASQYFVHIEKLDDHAHDTTKKFKVKGFLGTFAIISTMSAPFCGGCNRMRLSADGKMRNCLFASHEVDIATALRKGEDVRPLIKSCVLSKAQMLGGHSSTQWALERTESHERSMMKIGG